MGDDTTPDRGIRGMIRPEDTGYDTAWTSPEVVDCEAVAHDSQVSRDFRGRLQSVGRLKISDHRH